MKQLTFKDEFRCNVLLLGKTGAGKSSFANYLFGVEKFTTGIGKPVTDWGNNFNFYDIDIQGIIARVYDSVGLEVTNRKKWEDELLNFFEKHNEATNKFNDSIYIRSRIFSSFSFFNMFASIPINLNQFNLDKKQQLNINDCIHIVYYVVNAASARLENGDLDIIKELQEKYKICVVGILTNCDTAREEQIKAIEKIFANKDIKSIQVISIKQPTRKNQNPEQKGKEEATNLMLDATYDIVGKNFIEAMLNCMQNYVSHKKNEVKAKIDNSDLSVFGIAKEGIVDNIRGTIFNENSVLNQLDSVLDELDVELDFEIFNEAKNNLKQYIDFLDYFKTKFNKEDKLLKIQKCFDDIADEKEWEQLSNSFKSLQYKLDITELIGDSIKNFTSIKELLKQMSDERFDFLLDKISKVRKTLKFEENDKFLIYDEEDLAKHINNNKNNIEIEGELAEKIYKIISAPKATWNTAMASIVATYPLSSITGFTFVMPFNVTLAAPVAVGLLGSKVVVVTLKLIKFGGGIDVLNKLRDYDVEKVSENKIILRLKK